MTTEVQYPIAYADDDQLVHIDAAVKGVAAYCFGCDARMIPIQGPQRNWHFRHEAQNPCDRDRALHRAAVAAIAKGIETAIRANQPYLVEWECLRCGQPIEQDLATPGATVLAEKMLQQQDGIEQKRRTLPDVAVYNVDGTRAVTEVVVWHDLDDVTRKVYEQQEIPVFRVYPDWQTLHQYLHGASAKDALNTPSPLCTDCQRKDEQATNAQSAQAEQQRAELAERDLLARLVPKLHIPGFPPPKRYLVKTIEPGDCIIGLFTGVDLPGSRHLPIEGVWPRWNFEDIPTGLGICVAISPRKLSEVSHRHLIGKACLLTCWQEGRSWTGNRNFQFNLKEMSPSAT
ncbi:MAG: hypothetical protein OXC99_01020 [Chloroflexi bacterium]|nr:hypothetical protein [Chloroflexota bacterium]